MQYKAIGFNPAVSRDNPANTAASALEALLRAEGTGDWEFVGLQNHSTIVPGSSGCFGFGATASYPDTVSIAVFRHP